MRQLRYVRMGDEPDHAILETSDGAEQFVLLIDTALRDAARSDLPRIHPTPESPPRITPREIQTRVRAGELPQALAEENEMTLERVMRFAAPVIEERTRVASEARRGRARRSTTEGQPVVFGEAVDERFAAHGIEATAVRWDARRPEDGQWVVSAHWVGGEAERVAEWSFHLGTRTLAPLDDPAADLLSDRPIRPVATEPPPPNPAAPPLARGVVAFPVMPDARTGPLPRIEEVFDQNALPSEATPGFEAPPLPMPVPDPEPPAARERRAAPRLTNLGVANREDETEEQRAARARIPSWDDIMLGVRRRGD